MNSLDLVVGDIDTLRARLARDIGAALAAAGDGRFALALPGGSVASHSLPILASMRFDWDRTHIYWVDERAVPSSSPDSNFGMADTAWLAPASVPATSIHRMPADDVDLDGAAASYAEELTRTLGAVARLDLVLLGVGEDGHVASLFPGHDALAERQRLVVPVLDSPKPPPRRLTLTMPVLTQATRVIVMALGESKAAAVRAAVRREDLSLPLSLVLDRAKSTLVLLDEAAASLL